MSLGRSGCRGDGLLPPLEKGRVGEGIARRSILIPTRLAPLADLPFSRGVKPSSSHYIDSTKIHHTLACGSPAAPRSSPAAPEASVATIAGRSPPKAPT